MGPRRAAYERDTMWAPPCVADELRDAHIAEDTYRADAVLAWHRADAAADETERTGALREAGEYSALAQEIGAYREALTRSRRGPAARGTPQPSRIASEALDRPTPSFAAGTQTQKLAAAVPARRGRHASAAREASGSASRGGKSAPTRDR